MKHENDTVSVEKWFRKIGGEWCDDDVIGADILDSLPCEVFVATIEYEVSVFLHPGGMHEPPDVDRRITSANVECSVRLTSEQERFLISRYQHLADADW